MSDDPIAAAMLDTLRQTVAFQDLAAATGRPHEVLWNAYTQTLLGMRLPLYYRRLRKPEPKPKVYEAAIQSGLAIVTAFALATGVKQAIVRLAAGRIDALSFQPRPFAANWTATHALAPPALHNRATDPLVAGTPRPSLETADLLSLCGKVALLLNYRAFGLDIDNGAVTDGTTTFGFAPAPAALVVFRAVHPDWPQLNVMLQTIE
jgi:hypothetical protein